MPEPVPLRQPSVSFDDLALYARLVADCCGLRDWDVSVVHEPASGGTIAECLLADRRSIRVRVCEGFVSLPVEEQRHAFVHEMVHAHFEGAMRTVFEALDDWLPPQTVWTTRRPFEREMERGVDAMAVLLCAQVALPDWA